jgi:hypothetical protein
MNHYQKLEIKRSNDIVDTMLTKYGITETTTKIQKKNGTRMFTLPKNSEFPGHEFGVYKSGMVRKLLRSRFQQYTCYQLNKQYQQEVRGTYMNSDGEIYTNKYKGTARALIYTEPARLTYLLQYLIKNYGIAKVIPQFVEVDGVKYVRYE